MVAKNRIVSKLIWITLSTMPAFPVLAQDEPGQSELDTIIVTGRSTASPLGDVSGSVSVLDQQTLALVQHTHINETADRVPGVWISRGNGQEHLTAIRSPVLTGPGSCGSFLLLQDGIPTRPTGFCNVNQLFEINSEQAERIEIFRGPNGGVYGNNALHGIINVVTPDVTSSEQSKLALEGGPHDYARTLLSYSDGASVRMNGHLDHSGGYQDDSGYDQQKINVKHVSTESNIRRQSFVEITNLNQETAGYIEGNQSYKDDSQKEINLDPQSFRDAKSAHGYQKISITKNDGSEWQFTPYANTSCMEFLQHWVPTDPLEKNGHDSIGLNSRFSYPPTFIRNKQFTLVSGFNIEAARVYVDEYQQKPTSFGFVQGQHYDFDVIQNAASLFSELEYKVSGTVDLVTGFRYDHLVYDYNSSTPANTVGNYTRLADRDDEFSNIGVNAGIVWSWLDAQQVYANATTGHRAPEIAELYRLEGGIPARSVESEKIDGLELGFRGHFKPLIGNSLFYGFSVFDMQKDHVILKKQNRQYLGDGETSHRGLELNLDYRFLPTAYIKLNASYAEHRYEKVDGQLQGSPAINLENNIIDTAPRHFGSLQLGKYHSWGLIEFELKHLGPYYLDPEHDWKYEGHNLLNFRMQYLVRSDITCSARLLNVSNIDYAERADVNISNQPRYFVGEPRSLYLSIEKTFY